MSYAVRVAGDARADLNALEIWLQEEVWDELEMLLADPSILQPPSPDGGISYQFARDSASHRHIIFLTLGRNDFTKTLTLLGIAHDEVSP